MRRLLLLLSLLTASVARAHGGAAPAKADFTHPACPYGDPSASGCNPSLLGPSGRYVPEQGDASYHIAWVDGDTDPTAKFTFYWLDHGISDGVSTTQAETIGHLLRDTHGRDAVDIYASCACMSGTYGLDGGIPTTVSCPDLSVRWCDNFVDWDTHALADGAYWIVAVNNDQPVYHLYNLSKAPVRIVHGSDPKPPVVLVERPDGIGDADQSYSIALRLVGLPPFLVDLNLGSDLPGHALDPIHALANHLSVTPAADGSWTYLWDTSRVPDDVLFVRASVQDGSGTRSYSDSRWGVAVYHQSPPPDLFGAAPVDAAVPYDLTSLVLPPPRKTSSCSITSAGASASNTNSSVVIAVAVVLFALGAGRRALGRHVFRRRGSRPGSRSARIASGTPT